VEFSGENLIQGVKFIPTLVLLKASDSGIECLEEERFADPIRAKYEVYRRLKGTWLKP